MTNRVYEKLPYASELVPVTPWLPDSSTEECASLRRVFTRQRPDGSWIILELCAVVNETGSCATLSTTVPDSAGLCEEIQLDAEDGEVHTCVVIHVVHTEYEGLEITDARLTHLLNMAIAPFASLALQDSITEEDVKVARGLSSYELMPDGYVFES